MRYDCFNAGIQCQLTSWNECSSAPSRRVHQKAPTRMFRAAKHIRLAAIDFALRQSRHTRAQACDSLVVDHARHCLKGIHHDYHCILRRTRRA